MSNGIRTLSFLLVVMFCKTVNSDLQDVIKELNLKLSESQVKKDTSFIPGEQWAQQKGSYPSYVMTNSVGGIEQQILRNYAKFYDNNAFVTLWVTVMQLEAALLPGGPDPGEDQLSLALDAIHSYHDRNRQTSSSILVFWPQKLDESTGVWVCDAANIGAVAVDENVMSEVLVWLLKDIGLANDSEALKEFTQGIQEAVNEFHIPADADDTFVNIGLGGLLEKSKYKASYSKWQQDNPNIAIPLKAATEYSYQPFGSESTDIDKGLVDPRSYFFLRNFLYEQQNQSYSLSLPTTWMISFTENAKLNDKNVRMPFNLDNIDLTVSANVLYGLTAAGLSNWTIDTPYWFDGDMYSNIVDMLIYEMNHNFTNRPDLALTYYPSKFVFYWFTSRTLQLLKATSLVGKLPFLKMQYALSELESYLRSNFTNALLKEAVYDKSLAYYDDFLGGDDKDIVGKPVNNAEDRIFSTAMATNTLLYTWRDGTDLSGETPITVSTTIQQLCGWLEKHTLTGEYKPYNVFFSGSVKDSYLDMTFHYPTNYQYWLNGTKLPPDFEVTYESSVHSAVGMFGMEDINWYNEELQKEHFGKKTPTDFYGYNADQFAFWSSDELTYSATMLALTQCQYLFH